MSLFLSTLGDRLRARIAANPQPPPAIIQAAPEEPRNPFGLFRPPVGWSKDLDRVLALPRRHIETVTTPENVERLTQELRRPGGTMTLRPLQAAALLEAREVSGGFYPIGVGEGKTIISLLLPTVLKARVCVLLVRPDLKRKLTSVEYPELAQQWRIPNLHGATVFYPDTDCILHVVSYSQLSTASSADILDKLKPDLIVADEAHALAGNSARRKRFERYMRANPRTRFAALSGTMTSRSIKDFATLCRLALRDGAPVPHHWPTLEEWAGALDSSDVRTDPGELLRLCKPGEDVRDGFRRRLVETPGVVASSENKLGVSLIITDRELQMPKSIQKTLDEMRETWVTPSGEVLTDSLSFYRHARTVAAGLYLKWVWPEVIESDPAFKLEWLEARKLYHREVRTFLQHSSRPGMDSPLLLARAAVAGEWKSRHYARYAEAAREFRHRTNMREPETEAVWLDDFMVQDAAAWGRKHVGIIWFDHPDLGRAIAKAGGFPYYGASTETRLVTDPRTGEKVPPIVLEKGDRTVVASVRSWGTGWNLQAFNNQLVTTPSSSGKTWEQLLGRTHRTGQIADEVTCVVYRHTLELRESMKQAVKDAGFIEQTLGSRQKLLYCNITFDLA